MPTRRLSRDEIGQRGSSIYQNRLREKFDSSACGKFLAIDVETEEFELAEEAADAADRLWARIPDAQIFVERVGFAAAFHAYCFRGLASSL